ncbi:MAG: D-glycerate dehydrogenase [Lachnospiraceae bacterium]|nr:D-glycerate dehydrogenase [Lachnospiraceae bacterium]
MKKPVVFCTENKYIISDKTEAYLKEHVELIRAEERPTKEALMRQIGDADGLICMGPNYPVDSCFLNAAPRLRVISTTSVGYDTFNLAEMKQRGVIGLHTPDVLNSSVADHGIALMFAVSRRLTEMDKLVRQGKWIDTPFWEMYGCELSGKKLGIIGMGRIGETLARKVIAGFDMEVSYYNRSRKTGTEAELGVHYLPLDKLLQDSDYIVTLVPLTEGTYHMISHREFSLMKPGAIFINIARGPVVDEAALVEALENHEIYGAGLDGFEKEHFGEGNPLTKLPNTVLTPHIASATTECRERMGQLAARGLVEFFEGKTPSNLIPYFRK